MVGGRPQSWTAQVKATAPSTASRVILGTMDVLCDSVSPSVNAGSTLSNALRRSVRSQQANRCKAKCAWHGVRALGGKERSPRTPAPSALPGDAAAESQSRAADPHFRTVWLQCKPTTTLDRSWLFWPPWEESSKIASSRRISKGNQ